MDRRERAELVHAAVAGSWRRGASRERYGRRLVITRRPELIRNRAGEVVGVDAWVELYDERGNKVPIDSHRRIINPPTRDRAGAGPVEAFFEALWDSVIETPAAASAPGRGTVTTIYGLTSDGRVEAQGGTDYSTARQGSGTLLVADDTATTATGQFFSSTYSVYQQFWAFDTAVIPDDDEVVGVEMSLWMVQDQSLVDFTIEAREFNWGPTLEGSDFRPGSTLGSYTLLATLNTADLGSPGYYAFKSTAAFRSVSGLKTGTVYLFTSSSRQRAGNTPTGREWVQFSHAETSGTTQDPKLTITHYDAGTAILEDFEDSTLVVDITNTGFRPWARDNSQSYAGSWSYKAGLLTSDHNRASTAVVNVPPGGVAVSFYYRVSSESGWDFFDVYVGNTLVLHESGDIGWTAASFNLNGASTVTFEYNKDSSQSSGSDTAWIDELVFVVEPLEEHEGGASAAVEVDAVGEGSPGPKNGSTAAVEASSAGAGSPGPESGSSAAVSALSAGQGEPAVEGGDSAAVEATPAGSGSPATGGGAAAGVETEAQGGGSPVTGAGSAAAVEAVPAGAGSPSLEGGAAAVVEVAATGRGVSDSASGGSSAVVEVTASGGGIVRLRSDLNVIVGPSRISGAAAAPSRVAHAVGPSRTGNAVGPSRVGNTVGPSRVERGE